MDLSQHVQIQIAGQTAGMFDGLETIELTFLDGDAGQIPGALNEEQDGEKRGTDNQRQERILL